MVEDKRHTLVFTGYQSVGTLGRRIQGGAKEVRILGQSYHVNLQIDTLPISGHADAKELIDFVDHIQEKPKRIFLIHGDRRAVRILKDDLHKKFPFIQITDPEFEESFVLE